MKTNTQFTVMIHVLTLLATAEKPLSSAWIAGSVGTNPVVIRQVMAPLRHAGLVDTVPGSAGGARLAKPASDITLGNVYDLVKTDTLFALHHGTPSPHCLVGRNIQGVLTDVFIELDWMIEHALAKITIADMLAQVMDRDTSPKDVDA